MSRMRATALLLMMALAPQSVCASEDSRRLTARGLYLLQGGFEADAAAVFEQAVAADAADVDARYYRGMLRGNSGDLATSVADLRAVMAARPDFDEAALELGVGLVQIGEFAEAVGWLEQGRRVPSLAAKASLYLGIAHLRRQALDKAEESFRSVKTDDAKLSQAAHYYQGVVAYQKGNWDEAEAVFSDIVAHPTGSAFDREAAAFLENLRSGEQRPIHLRGSVGFEYDSNVLLAPDDQSLKQQAGVSNQEDGRFSVAAGASYVRRFEPVRIAASYDFYQSLHFDLDEFNLQDHRPAVEISANLAPVQFGVLGEYNFYLREDSRFLQEGTVLPWIAVGADEWGRTELSYRMRRRDFLQDQFEVRDAVNHAWAVRQVVYLGPSTRYVAFGYRFDIDDPVRDGESRRFAYFANEVNAGVGCDLPFEIGAQAGYAYRHERYKRASGVYVDSGRARRDDEHDIVVALVRPLGESMSVITAYSGTLNDSNAQAFEYDRHIVSLALQVRW